MICWRRASKHQNSENNPSARVICSRLYHLMIFYLRKLCDENTNPSTRYVLSSEVAGWLRVFRQPKHVQRWCSDSSCSLCFHWRAFIFLRKSWHVLVARLIEGRVELVAENKMTRSSMHLSRRILIEKLPRCTLNIFLCELKYGGQVKYLSLPRSIWCLGSGPERSLTFQGTSEAAKPPLKDSHPKLLHPSADDSQTLDQPLNEMSQNGKCLVNVPCDSWSMVFPVAA